VLIAPVLPGISDDPRMLRDVVGAAIDAGATHVSPILLHLRPGVREEFLPWLREAYPGLVGRYESMYERSYAPAADRRALGRTVGRIARALGASRPSRPRGSRERFLHGEPRPEAAEQPRQLTLA
jgi:DNA repair photolyase